MGSKALGCSPWLQTLPWDFRAPRKASTGSKMSFMQEAELHVWDHKGLQERGAAPAGWCPSIALCNPSGWPINTNLLVPLGLKSGGISTEGLV